MCETFDVCVVGGGIVGLATAYEISTREPSARVVVLEREAGWARHQTGHNSGVIHSGIYYKPGSLKASLTRRGLAAMYDFCARHDLPVERCGKVIVARRASELPGLDALAARAEQNGVEAHPLTPVELRRREPSTRGLGALLVPETGITDYAAVSAKLAELLASRGVELRLRTTVERVDANGCEGPATLRVEGLPPIQAERVVAAVGVHSDTLAAASGTLVPARIVPFRGEYYELRPNRRHLVNHLIYPVPDPDLPFLGVHMTRAIDGSVHVGPNAVLALSREGYRARDIDLTTVRALWATPGLRPLARRYWRTGIGEIGRSLSKTLFLPRARSLLPALRARDLERAPAGVRAQALDASGALLDDFLFHRVGRCLHVINAPSPAATASFAISEVIADEVLNTA